MRTYLSWSGRYMKPISTCTVEADTAIVPVPGMHIEAAEWSGNAELLEIRLPGPLDLESTLECGQAFRWNRVKGPDGRTWFRGVVDSIGVMVTTDDASRLLVLYEPNGTDRDSLARRIFSYFSLDDDLDAIHRFLLEEACPESRHRQHEVIKQAVRHARGLRILRQEPWECLVSYIISANKNIPAICKTVDYLAQSLGSPAGLGQYTFPTPQALLEAGADCVKQSKCGYRAPYILDAAGKVLDKQVDLLTVQHLPTDQARHELLKIMGVGPKVADCALLFGYHRLEVFPVDVWIARCMSVFFTDGKALTPKEARQEGSRRFGPYAGYTQQILFHYSRNVLRGRL